MALVWLGMMMAVGLATNHSHEVVGTGAGVGVVDVVAAGDGDYGKGFGGTLDLGDRFGYNLEETEQENLGVSLSPYKRNQKREVLTTCWLHCPLVLLDSDGCVALHML